MNKRGQLAWIEMQFVFWGFLVGLVGGLVLTFLGSKDIIPFKIPLVCGSVMLGKKGQLGAIEFKYFIIGFVIGLIGALVLTYLGTAGILPFKIPLVCG
jgi:CHASE2 domain-containing sensor protein